MDDLETLIRLHKAEVDARRLAVADLEMEQDRFRAGIAALDQALVDERGVAAHSFEAATAFGPYLEASRQRRAMLEEQIGVLEMEILAARDLLRDAYAELKKFELSAERQAAASKALASRREQQQLDEVGLSIFRRREN
jgi:flagellar export protein FliJ